MNSMTISSCQLGAQAENKQAYQVIVDEYLLKSGLIMKSGTHINSVTTMNSNLLGAILMNDKYTYLHLKTPK